MGGIVSGLLGGGKGNQFQAQSAPIINPVTQAQATGAYDQSQAALKQQQDLLAALQAQNGIQNQSSVFNQLQNVASGQGPNPAQAMLANATGANVANQAALMAGQRGAGSNVGLIGRQAAQQGAGIQQNAAGQAALMQAQQSLGALNNLGAMANQQVAQQQSATGDLNRYNQAEQQQLLGSIANQNQANVSNTSQMNNANAEIARQTASQQGNLLSGLMGGIGTAVAGPLGGFASQALGGIGDWLGGLGKQAPGPLDSLAPGASHMTTNGMAEGGAVSDLPKGPMSKVGQHFHGKRIAMAQGGKVPALVSPGEQYLKPQDVQKVKQGANPLKVGEKIPGRPMHPGNDYRNDVIPKNLDEGGIVIPNKVLQSKNPHKEAAKFVAAVLAKHGKKLK